MTAPITPAGGWLVACGMYTFPPSLQTAWRALFARLPHILPAINPLSVTHRSDAAIYRNPALLLGHTCGYPYLKKWAATHLPVCVPLFAVDGCRGAQYSSWFITSAASALTNLESARGKRVAVNDLDSNSGMNVLRYAVAELGGGLSDNLPGELSGELSGEMNQFFSAVIISSSHMRSIELVARQQVELAAIDAVTFAFATAHQPDLSNQIRIIAQSTHSTAPPFIAPITSIGENDHRAITDALNECLHNLDDENSDAIKLNGFQQVSADDYKSIQAMEQFAVARGYPRIV